VQESHSCHVRRTGAFAGLFQHYRRNEPDANGTFWPQANRRPFGRDYLIVGSRATEVTRRPSLWSHWKERPEFVWLERSEGVRPRAQVARGDIREADERDAQKRKTPLSRGFRTKDWLRGQDLNL
jgi:hypothetical protein